MPNWQHVFTMLNNAKTVILISPFFFPEQIATGKYNSALVQALVATGCRVEVITSHPLYPEWRPRKSNLSMAGANVHRGGGWIRFPKSPLLRRAVLELWFTFHATVVTLRLRKSVDYLLPIFPPSLFFLFVTLLLPPTTRRIGIVHDLQGVHVARFRGAIFRIVAFAIHWVEARAFRSCNKLLFLSRSMAEEAIVDYQLQAKNCTVCYPFSTVVVSENYMVAETLAQVFPRNLNHVVYAGAMGEKQAPEELLAFFECLVFQEPTICCHILSGGPKFDTMRRNQESQFQERIQFHDLVPEEQLGELYARSDVQIIPQAPGTGKGSLPSKLPNLLGAGVPVFAICDSDCELAEIVRASGIGYVCHSTDPARMVGELVDFVKVTKNRTHQQRAAQTREFISRNFSIERVVSEIFSEAD